jgi:hypothetical protein
MKEKGVDLSDGSKNSQTQLILQNFQNNNPNEDQVNYINSPVQILNAEAPTFSRMDMIMSFKSKEQTSNKISKKYSLELYERLNKKRKKEIDMNLSLSERSKSNRDERMKVNHQQEEGDDRCTINKYKEYLAKPRKRSKQSIQLISYLNDQILNHQNEIPQEDILKYFSFNNYSYFTSPSNTTPKKSPDFKTLISPNNHEVSHPPNTKLISHKTPKLKPLKGKNRCIKYSHPLNSRIFNEFSLNFLSTSNFKKKKFNVSHLHSPKKTRRLLKEKEPLYYSLSDLSPIIFHKNRFNYSLNLKRGKVNYSANDLFPSFIKLKQRSSSQKQLRQKIFAKDGLAHYIIPDDYFSPFNIQHKQNNGKIIHVKDN